MQKKAGYILVFFAMLISGHLYASNDGAQKPKHCKSIRVLTFTYDKDKRDSSFGVIRSRFVNMNQGNVPYPNLIIRVRNKYNVVVPISRIRQRVPKLLQPLKLYNQVVIKTLVLSRCITVEFRRTQSA